MKQQINVNHLLQIIGSKEVEISILKNRVAELEEQLKSNIKKELDKTPIKSDNEIKEK